MTLAQHKCASSWLTVQPRLPPNEPQVMTLAQHKYASNVVEACLKHGRQAHRDAVVE